MASHFAYAGQLFVDRTGYLGQVLHGAATRPPRPSPKVAWTTKGGWLGVLSTALALGLGALGIYRQRLPERLRAATRSVSVSPFLHRLHSGHVGDYVAWLFLGVTGMAALVGLAH